MVFGGLDSFREPLIIDAEEFTLVRGFKAKGKRISTFEIQTINELEPIRFPVETTATQVVNEENLEDENSDREEKSNSDIIDEITGQMKLFDD